jgi:hypothetical protein
MHNDFDPANIKESLDVLDDELDGVEDSRPEDEGDIYDQEIAEVMAANQALRLKVGEISDYVAKAIVKANQI